MRCLSSYRKSSRQVKPVTDALPRLVATYATTREFAGHAASLGWRGLYCLSQPRTYKVKKKLDANRFLTWHSTLVTPN
jgi:hypothetical protein